jgi:hypothetical protein
LVNWAAKVETFFSKSNPFVTKTEISAVSDDDVVDKVYVKE